MHIRQAVRNILQQREDRKGLYMSIDEMKEVDVRTVQAENLVDIRNTKINQKLSGGKRAKDYVEQIKNPYCYKYGDYIVKIGFMNTNVNITDRLRELVYKTTNTKSS